MAERVLVLGAGASGLMAAITAARAGAKVTVLEQNEKPGKKLLATGNGRCNLTNLKMQRQAYYSDDLEFLTRVMGHFDETSVLEFFHSIGLATIDRQGWVYPLTEQASSVLSLLLLLAAELKIKIKTNETVTKVTKEPLGSGSEFVVITQTWQYRADAVIVATGSPASAVRGSTDAAAQFAEYFHIRHANFIPALTSLKVKDTRASKWQGTRVRGSITLLVDGSPVQKETGELQLIENGVSGIPVFQVSSAASRALTAGKHVDIELNFMPDLTDEELTDDCINRLEACPFKNLSQMLIGLLPEKLIPLFAAGGGGRDLHNMSLSQVSECLAEIAYSIRHCKLHVRATGDLSQSQVASGGILTEELKDSMESRSVSGLYFCGESVNVDGCCGGYNLQWAWASGYTAGISAAYK